MEDESATHTMVTLSQVEKARQILTPIVRETPLVDCAPLATRVGGPVYLKCENLQRAGSFKVRGAFVRISQLSDEEKQRGVVAASMGNHAQGVALTAGHFGIPATIFMPRITALPKVAATRAYGARVLIEGETVMEALESAKQFADETGALFIHPFDHPDIIAGQGTVGLEIAEQCPEVKTVLVSTGGGGLLSGIAVALHSLLPHARVVGVQAEGAASYPASLAAGHPVMLPNLSTVADGIAVGRPGELPFAHVVAHQLGIVTVSDEEIMRAVLFCLERAKQVVEPAGAAAVAALLDQPRRFEPPVVAVLSGGNVDPLLLLQVIERGLTAAGRYLHFTVRVPDRPGSLSNLLALIADEGVNVVDVSHHRRDSRLRLGEAEVALSVETKGSGQSEQLIHRLRAEHYVVTFN